MESGQERGRCQKRGRSVKGKTRPKLCRKKWQDTPFLSSATYVCLDIVFVFHKLGGNPRARSSVCHGPSGVGGEWPVFFFWFRMSEISLFVFVSIHTYSLIVLGVQTVELCLEWGKYLSSYERQTRGYFGGLQVWQSSSRKAKPLYR